jgi:hypothetical protein
VLQEQIGRIVLQEQYWPYRATRTILSVLCYKNNIGCIVLQEQIGRIVLQEQYWPYRAPRTNWSYCAPRTIFAVTM